jgi:release factor glutamine methyltransferase
MLPTPSTGHVPFERVYEPAEDSFLLLDTLSSEAEKTFLQGHFALPLEQVSSSGRERTPVPSPVVAEVGTGSGVVLAFVNAHAQIIFGRSDILTVGIDVNVYACKATEETVRIAAQDQIQQQKSCGHYLGNLVGDLAMPLRSGIVDMLIFNPPYVPTPELPRLPFIENASQIIQIPSFEDDSHFLSLSYAGGTDGMETTNRLLNLLPETISQNGVAYILLSAQNKPDLVKEQIRRWGPDWLVETVGSSGKKAGWEKLQIIRIWQNLPRQESKPC